MREAAAILTCDEIRAAEKRAVDAGAATMAGLMDRAGEACARVLHQAYPEGRVVVLAGPGNNGGDAFVAARHLAGAGRRVRVGLLGDRSTLKGDASAAADAWTGETIDAGAAMVAGADLIIDGLFGAGLSKPLTGVAAEIVRAVNASGTPVLAIDVPSGLDGATGRPLADLCVKATETVTFVRLKPGHVLMPGRALCGSTHLADIGAPDAAVEEAGARAFLNRPALWRAALPEPTLEGHKYSRGHVAVWSGAELATGASRLSALSALRAGAGAVTLIGDRDALRVHAAHLTAVMLRVAPPDGWKEFLAERKVAVALVGPGAGATSETRGAVEQALGHGRGAVLDADVFTLFAGDADGLARLIAAGGGEAVLTPHEGEFRRVFGEDADDAPSKLERARAAARRVGAVVLIKGPDTVVAAPDGRAAIADNAPPTLATAGAGDVLAGLCAGLMAQGAPAFEAAAAAVWIHGEAANIVGRGMIADDLPGAIPEVLRRLAGMDA
ncbi:MAG: NAD(P)H-hydrate dehydratase [Hansschlegelia sp.]